LINCFLLRANIFLRKGIFYEEVSTSSPKGPVMTWKHSLLLPLSFSFICCMTGLTGCSNMVATATGTPSAQQTGSLTGVVYGGQQPVANATVTVWAAGNTGYGSAATALATETSSANGSFSFGPGSGHTYSCPSSVSGTASQSIYITASGGQPTTGVTNNQAAFMVALGDCLSIQLANPNITLNEVTTVASITALQQFFTPDTTNGLGSVGTTTSNALGLANAMKTVANLVNLASGSANATTTVSGAVPGYTTNPVVTITPEQAKINAEADILASCINTAGTGSGQCNTLFNNVNNTKPLDTLQAAYYMASNPTSTTTSSSVSTCTTGAPVTTTSTICNLFGLINSSAPFPSTLTSAPTDWTIAVTYGSNSTQTVSATPVYLLNSPAYIALDSLGNVWALNSTTAAAGAVGNSVTELSPTGVPEAQVLTAAGQLVAPRNIVVDPSNDLFVANYGVSGAGNSVAAFNNTTLATQSFPLLSTGPVALASDGAGNIYVANQGATTTGGAGDLEIIPSGSANGTTAVQVATAVSAGTNSVLALDSYDDLWLSNFGSTATTQFICSQKQCLQTVTTAGGQTGSRSVAVDHANNIWVGNTGNPGSISEVAATSTTSINGTANSPFSGGGLLNPTYSVFGGLGNQWITNNSGSTGSVTELTPQGVAVSPSVGFLHTYSGPVGIGIDASGNVWLGNSSAAPTGYITEIVGAGGPTITPYAANLPATANGVNTIGNRP
jgi:hypothetical protein